MTDIVKTRSDLPRLDDPDRPPFTHGEYERRLHLVRRAMAERALGALLVFGAANVYYLTGYDSVNSWDFQCCVVGPDGSPALVIFDFELGRFLTSCWIDQVVPYGAAEDPIATVRATLDALGLLGTTLGVEESSPNLGVTKHRRLVEARAG
jgi:Xaa-Pro dipeptidase